MKYAHLNHLPSVPVSHDPAIQKRVVLRAGELPHLTQFAQAVLQPGQCVPAHVHADMSEVFWVVAGAGEMGVGDRALALNPGTCVAVEAGESHWLVNTGAEDLVLTYFGIATGTA